MPPIVKRQDNPLVQRAMDGATDNYDVWSEQQDFVRAQRQGRVQYVVHTGTVRHEHVHVHYDGGPVPNWGE
jgi:hypothetical protein